MRPAATPDVCAQHRGGSASAGCQGRAPTAAARESDRQRCPLRLWVSAGPSPTRQHRCAGANWAAATRGCYFGSSPRVFSSDKYARGVADNPVGAERRAETPRCCPAHLAAVASGPWPSQTSPHGAASPCSKESIPMPRHATLCRAGAHAWQTGLPWHRQHPAPRRVYPPAPFLVSQLFSRQRCPSQLTAREKRQQGARGSHGSARRGCGAWLMGNGGNTGRAAPAWCVSLPLRSR